jgi:hypothetical protein
MKRAIVIVAALSLVVVFSYRWYSSRQADRFVAEKKAEFSGYRVEYMEQQKLMFLHRPDGSKDGVDMARLRRVDLYRRNARDSANNQKSYFWRIGAPPIDILIPYFSVDPAVMLQVLKKEHPELDLGWSLNQTKKFEHDKFNLCTIWAQPGNGDLSSEKGYNEYGYNYCER